MSLIAGFDEVGRGAWAGPLLICGTVIETNQLAGLRDSKQLSRRKRQEFTQELLREVKALSLQWVAPCTIDEYGLGVALRNGFVACASEVDADRYVVDGAVDYLGTSRSQAVVRGDESVPAVAAASIIAKYYRDTYMKLIDTLYPVYGFKEHVGYGTAAHKSALSRLGASPIHRRSFKPVAKHV